MKLVWDRKKQLQVMAGPASVAFAVQAMVVEQDRNLLLSEPEALSDAAIADSRPAWYLANLLESQPEYAPGSVLCVSNRRPILIQAIVHDIESSPTWRIEWVQQAMGNILREVERQRLHSLGLPFLGTCHGKMDPEQFVALLRKDFLPRVPACLTTLWLITPEGYDNGELMGLQD